MKEKQARVQYRYYETPPNTHILPLLGTGWIREYGNDINELHFHNCLEIGYCHDGAGTMTFGEKKIPYRGGMFSVVPPNYLHTTNSLVGRKCRWEYLFVDVEGFLTEMYPANQQMSRLLAKKIHSGAALVNHEENVVTAELILAIMDECREKTEFFYESVRGLLLALLVDIARMCGEENVTEQSEVSGPGVIAAAIEYVDKHYSEKIKVSELAETCHLSETHFRRLFLRSMHITPLAYVNRIRVEAACRLLITTDETVGDIAVQCGFITISDLNRNFKEIVEMPPSKWRRDSQYYERKLKDQKILAYEGWR